MLSPGHCFEGFGSFERWGLAAGSRLSAFEGWIYFQFWLAFPSVCHSENSLTLVFPCGPRCPPPWWTENESQPIPPPFFCLEALTCGSHEEKLSGMGLSPSSELPVHSQKCGDTRWPNIAFLQPGRRGPCPFDSWSYSSNFQEGEK